MNEQQPSTLQGLLDMALQRHQISGRAMAAKAQQAGHRITHATINAIKAGTYKSAPSDDTIRAIGWLAGVSEEAAFTAAGRRVPGPPLADELPDGVDNLSPKARKAVIDLLRVLVAAEESGGVAEAAPMKRAGESPVDMDEFKARRRRLSATDDEDAGVPMPDVERMPAYGVPQESIQARDQQDADAEGSQLPPEED